MTKRQEIARYVEIAGKHIKLGGHLVVSTFSKEGPKKCSGLDITQYSEDLVKKTFKKYFKHMKSFDETHATPFGTTQNFLWSVFKKTNWPSKKFSVKF